LSSECSYKFAKAYASCNWGINNGIQPICVNADGQITEETCDQNITVARSYNAASGRIDRIITGGGAVQDLACAPISAV